MGLNWCTERFLSFRFRDQKILNRRLIEIFRAKNHILKEVVHILDEQMKSKMSLSLHRNVSIHMNLLLQPRLKLSSDDSLAIRHLAVLAIIMKGDKYLSSLNEPISGSCP